MQKMALAIYQFNARVPSAYFQEHKDSMCAGLCHFSTGFVRCWGRDTFIALRGLYIATGLEHEAKNTILYFAKVTRHGLIPNLHDGGNNTRFNARDAAWFFLQAIKDYCLISEDGLKFLNTKVQMHFLDDDMETHLKLKEAGEKGKIYTLLELVIEIVERHSLGIEYREWNAGPKCDNDMAEEGFNVSITCDHKETGFCFGGNKHNCGTWMDKNGSSEETGNKGIPATPRDGAPIELVAM
jgi:glycogen debranching enzyme